MKGTRARFFAARLPGRNGFQISHQRGGSRRTFDLRAEASPGEPPPLAAESFALDPDHYFALLDRAQRCASHR